MNFLTDQDVIKVYSWTIINSSVAIKKTDYSSFKHRGTTIPRKIYPFFKIENLGPGKKLRITLNFERNPLQAHFIRETHELQRIRLFWDSKFSEMLRKRFKGYQNFEKEDFPDLFFERVNDDTYNISIISDENALEDCGREDVYESLAEGKKTKVYSTKYERNPRNREGAVRVHGMKCLICGFDFEENYGNVGRGFIEVHHKKPISSFEGELIIDPVQDMVCLCSNCHRMIHRKKGRTLSIDELRESYTSAQNKKK